jgi:hypothetical protein
LSKKKLLVISDFHCGHYTGLTPPKYNPKYDDPDLNEESAERDRLYKWFKDELRKIGKVDLTIANGDLIDGRGEKSGGTELIEPDRNQQVEMAAHVLENINTKELRITYGTPYHTGKTEDFEDMVARIVKCPMPYATVDVEMNGVVFNFKHKIGGSSIPHGRATALLRDKLWNELWAARGEYPRADVIVRSHVHYFVYAGGLNSLSVITPALQGYGSKFGTRQVSGTVDYVFVHFEVDSHGNMTWEPHILRMPMSKAEQL